MKLKTAVIGVGYLGRFHAQKHAQLAKEQSDQFELAGVFDLHAPQAQTVATEVGCRAFASIDEVIAYSDVIAIATVTQTHFEIAKKCLQAGKHVLVEKPICPTSEQAQELVEIAQKQKVVLSAGHSERFSTVYEKLMSMNQKWQSLRLQRYATYKKRGADVSVVHDLMVHDLDLACGLLGKPEKILHVSGGTTVSSTWDWCEASFLFSGILVTIGSSRLASEMTRTVRAINSQFCFEGNFQTGDVTLSRFNAKASEEAQLVVAEKMPLGRTDTLYLETKNFFEAIVQKKTPRISAEASAYAVKLADELVRWPQKS